MISHIITKNKIASELVIVNTFLVEADARCGEVNEQIRGIIVKP